MIRAAAFSTPRAVEAATEAAAYLDSARLAVAPGERTLRAYRVYCARRWWRLARDYARRGL